MEKTLKETNKLLRELIKVQKLRAAVEAINIEYELNKDTTEQDALENLNLILDQLNVKGRM